MKKSKSRSLRAVLGVIGLTLMLGGCLSGLTKKHPSDAELLANFQKHKPEFDHLLQMFVADKGLGRVAPDFTRPSDPRTVGVSLERLSEYRKIFRALGLANGIEGYDEKAQVWFMASSQGLSVTGSGKGYAYTSERPVLVVDSLDNYWSKDGQSFVAFRHIEGNWYLYLEYED